MSSLAISRDLGIAKSTVTNWLKDYPLTAEEIAQNRSIACREAGKRTTEEQRAILNQKNRKLVANRRASDPFPALSTTKKGKAAELIFAAKCLLKDLLVYTVATEDSPVDCIVGSHRCQVKIISPTNQCISLKTTRRSGKSHRYTDEEIDFFVGVDIVTFDCYVLPVAKLKLYASTISRTALESLAIANDFILLES